MEVLKILSRRRELPEELLTEILFRLPVKSLIRFTCVCKYWFSLIKSPQFATKHFSSRINLLQQNDCHCLVTFSSDDNPIVKFLSYETLENFAIFECRPTDESSADSKCSFSWSFCGPCNGIFCIQMNKFCSVFLLWNPATRELFVPDQPCRILPYVGFGFDHKTNDYKIVMFDYSGNVQLYSLRANSWREIEVGLSIKRGTKHRTCTDSTSNGRMYNWMLYHFLSERNSLLSFDMVDEVFIETAMPEGVKNCHFSFLHQRSRDSHPSLFSTDLVDRPPQADIWVLNKYGPTGYWTKERSFTLTWPQHIYVAIPRGLWKSEEVLIIEFNADDEVLALYNIVTQETISLPVPGSELLGYTESLISIKDVCQPGEREESSRPTLLLSL